MFNWKIHSIVLGFLVAFSPSVFASGAKAPKYDEDISFLEDGKDHHRHLDRKGNVVSEGGHGGTRTLFGGRDFTSAHRGGSGAFRSGSDHSVYDQAGSPGSNGAQAAPQRRGLFGRIRDAGRGVGNYVSSYVNESWNRMQCPHLDDMVERMAKPKKYGCGPYNDIVLEEIGSIRPGQGYSMGNAAATGGVNIPVQAGNRVLSSGSGGASFCSGALYAIFMRTVNRIDPTIFTRMNEDQLDNFTPGLPDYKGFFGAVNGSHHGIKDANRLVRFGDEIDGIQSACAGDFMQFDRTNSKYGHAAIFLGEKGGKTYYWASSGQTGGYGVRCEPTNTLIPRIVRLKYPKNLLQIEAYSGRSYKQNYLKDRPIEPGSIVGPNVDGPGPTEKDVADRNHHRRSS